MRWDRRNWNRRPDLRRALQPILPILALVICTLLAAGCSEVQDLFAVPTTTPTLTQTLEPTHTSTPTTSPTLTSTPAPTDTPTRVATQSPGFTLTPEAGGVVTSTLGTGWIFYQVPGEGFGIALPPEWLRIGLSPEAFEEVLVTVGEQSPELQEMLTSETLRTLVAGGLIFYALDISPESLEADFPTTVNVLKVDLGMEVPLDLYASLNMAQVEDIADPRVPVTHQRVTLTGLEAEQINYAAEYVNAAGDPVLVKLTQYIALDGSTAYIITLATPLELAYSYSAIFEQIEGSIQLLE